MAEKLPQASSDARQERFETIASDAASAIALVDRFCIGRGLKGFALQRLGCSGGGSANERILFEDFVARNRCSDIAVFVAC